MRVLITSEGEHAGSRLVLGTAQLGLPYGIANRTGQPDFEMAVSLIKTAWENGIREFDTAQAYGESEAVLGKVFTSLGISREVRVITKLAPKLEPLQGEEIKRAVDGSLKRLQIPFLYGIMLHREEWLDKLAQGLEKTLQTLVLDGSVQHLGVSLYTPAMALRALEADIFEMIQVPANVLDHRFAAAGVFNLADVQRKQVYIRSVFLQGLLVMKPGDLPARMAFAKPTLEQLDNLCAQYSFTRQEIALLYIKGRYPQAKIVLGAETQAQLAQNLKIWRDNFTSISVIEEFDHWPIADERIINPSLWS